MLYGFSRRKLHKFKIDNLGPNTMIIPVITPNNSNINNFMLYNIKVEENKGRL
jgi:hypothetical protein